MKKNIFKKINKKTIIFLGIGFAALAISVPIILNNVSYNSNTSYTESNGLLKSDGLTKQDESFKNVDFNPLVPSVSKYLKPFIQTKRGPIVWYGTNLRALDWYGKILWEFDSREILPDYPDASKNKMETTLNDWIRWQPNPFANFTYDQKNDILWLLSTSYKIKTPPQNVAKFNAITGTLEYIVPIDYIPSNNFDMFYGFQLLGNGTLIAFNQGNPDWTKVCIFDPTKKTSKVVNGNAKVMADIIKIQGSGQARGKYLVPLGNNMNIVVLMNQGDQNPSNVPNSDYLCLVDDNMNRFITDTNNPWSSAVLAYNTNENIAGTTSKDAKGESILANYYNFIDGQRTLYVLKNKAYIFWNSLDSNGELKHVEYDFGKYVSPDNNRIVDSWTVDTNENLFVKFRSSGTIFKLTINGNAPENTTFSLETYYDLLGSNIDLIKQTAPYFKLYNVYGYSGQIMLISSYQVDGAEAQHEPTKPSDITNFTCGLLVGIVSNPYESTKGDTKGLLNTQAAFEFSPNFDIAKSVLDSKLPSEISERDLELLNNSFFTTNATINATGNLVYSPFVKKNIDDKAGTFQIEVNLDQIPWFTTQLPQNFIPTKISKVFNTKTQISSRVQWKSTDVDYNFKNTLPSKVTVDDLNNFDPFLIDLVSQRILDSTNNQIYPKKTYSVTKADDSTGIITVQCIYQYMPIGVPALSSNALSYTITNDFTIFKNDKSQTFNWIGTAVTSDIKNIPSLKELSENNLLPSSIDGSDSNFFLKFIDINTTKGYPLNKMTFSVTPNDATGTISIQAILPKGYYGQTSDEVFTKIYSGFNKTSNYSFIYRIPTNLSIIGASSPSIDNIVPSIDYKKLLPSNITEEMIYDDFIQYAGYNSLDLDLSLIPNNNNGSLKIQFILSNDYPSILGTTNSFSKIGSDYVSSITLGGFLTFADYQKQHSITFKNNSDASLTSLKSLELTTIFDKLNSSQGLVVDNITYKSKLELSKLFISSYGVSLPSLKESNVNFFSDSLSGELTLEIQLPIIETGLANNLIFNSVFTGFRQGVTNPTNDSFVFKNHDSLDTNLFNKSPSEIKSEIENTPSLLRTYFVSFVSGQFATLINDPSSYTLTIDANDLYGTISIEIEFKNLTNTLTLKTYAKNYSGFLKSSL